MFRTSVLWVVLCFGFVGNSGSAHGEFRAGAARVDITPLKLPVIRNGGFIEGSATKVDDPLHARCIVLDDGETRIAIVVVDSCMMPVELCDEAKRLAVEQTEILHHRITVTATHTHSAPSVMDYTLGSRADPEYTAFLPAKIAEAIVLAEQQLTPAKVGWGRTNAAGYTKNRRWITRSDRLLEDPFGERTIHAMMHPGHQNPEYVGPSGPIDPWLSVLKVDSVDGAPIALLANFSMHYFAGHAGVSADYFGRFAAKIAERLAPDKSDFVGIMSQGTSGDLWWGDYSVSKAEKPFDNIDQFTNGLVDKVIATCGDIETKADVRLAMAEQRLTLGRRLPDERRLSWARRKLALLGDERPRDKPEVYAQQAVYLHENPTVTVPIQAIRIGDLGITTLPNEVYAITGLKLKTQSPLPMTFNLSLANGASGYIPPPEQHALGGYTTWPARTAGLEEQAEPKIVDGLLTLLEQLSRQTRKPANEVASRYSKSITKAKPIGYWRLGDLSGPRLQNAMLPGEDQAGKLTALGDVAYHLPGRDVESFGVPHENRAIQLAGGKLMVEGCDLDQDFTLLFHFLIATPTDFRGTTATLIEYGEQHLTVTGTDSEQAGRLCLGDSTDDQELSTNVWYQIVFQRKGGFVHVYLNDGSSAALSSSIDRSADFGTLTIGGDAANSSNLEGRIDELSLFGTALDVDGLTKIVDAN